MENIAPNLILLWDVLWALERGLPVTNGIQNYLRRSVLKNKKNGFKDQIEMWWMARLGRSHRPEPAKSFDKSKMSATSRQLLLTIELGLQGESILAQLKALETEMLQGCDEEIQMFAAYLPLKMMLPLFGLIFPSFFILLVVPLLRMLQF
jgi:hypothetical protein